MRTLQSRNLTLGYDQRPVVQDLTVELPAGQVSIIVGANACGKSTLLRGLARLLKPTAGRVYMDGQDVTTASPQKRAGRGLARTFQHPELFTSLSVREHLILAYRMRHSKSRIWTDLITGRFAPDE